MFTNKREEGYNIAASLYQVVSNYDDTIDKILLTIRVSHVILILLVNTYMYGFNGLYFVVIFCIFLLLQAFCVP